MRQRTIGAGPAVVALLLLVTTGAGAQDNAPPKQAPQGEAGANAADAAGDSQPTAGASHEPAAATGGEAEAAQSQPDEVTERSAEAPQQGAPTPPGPDADVKERLAYWDKAALPPPHVPEGVRHRPPLSDFDRRTKRAQKPFSVIGVPQLGGNPDLGFIIGAVSAITWHSTPEDDPYYDFTPFDRRIIVQAQASLKRRPDILARQDYQLRYIAPYWFDTLFYLDVTGRYQENASAQYFGVSANTMRSLRQIGPAARADDLATFGGQNPGRMYDTSRFDRDFDSFGDYFETLREVEPASDGVNATFAQFHNYKIRQPIVSASLRYALLGGLLTPAITLNLSKVFIQRYDGREIRVSADERGDSAPTLLDLDCAKGVAKYCKGTWDNSIKLSMALDTRDFAADPKRGFLVDVSFETAPTFLGSPGYNRLTTSGHFYINPFLAAGIDNKYLRMVFAGRVLYSVQGGDLPFYAINRLSFFDRSQDGLGGIGSMRGYRLNRFVGRVMVLGNLELRYDVFSFNTKRSTVVFKLVPHIDTGAAYDEVGDTDLGDLRVSGGAGLYLQWNQSNVIRMDVGVGDEGMSFGINYGFMY